MKSNDDNESQPAATSTSTLNVRNSSTNIAIRVSMDEKSELPSPSKERGIGFKSFFSRLGAKRLSIPPINIPVSVDLSQQKEHQQPSLSPGIVPPTSVLSPTRSTFNSLTKCSEVPPFYEAYAISIKVASLAALTTSSDTILRRNMETKKEKKGKFSGRARSSSKIEMEWTQKMFLLTPTMLLQYSGDGAVDRLPEKVVHLTPTSVAFVSDIIPGQPYVLQVSQSATADGTPIAEEKRDGSWLKLPWKGSSKHLAVSQLLVFDNSKEMDAWMGCIRVEAAKLAGTWEAEPEETEVSPHERTSLCSLTRRVTIRREEDDDIFDLESSNRFSRYSRNSRTSFDAGTSYSTSSSIEQTVLDRLRGSRSQTSIKTSYGLPTVATSTAEATPDRSSISFDPFGRRSSASAPKGRSSLELRCSFPSLTKTSSAKSSQSPSTSSPSKWRSISYIDPPHPGTPVIPQQPSPLDPPHPGTPVIPQLPPSRAPSPSPSFMSSSPPSRPFLPKRLSAPPMQGHRIVSNPVPPTHHRSSVYSTISITTTPTSPDGRRRGSASAAISTPATSATPSLTSASSKRQPFTRPSSIILANAMATVTTPSPVTSMANEEPESPVLAPSTNFLVPPQPPSSSNTSTTSINTTATSSTTTATTATTVTPPQFYTPFFPRNFQRRSISTMGFGGGIGPPAHPPPQCPLPKLPAAAEHRALRNSYSQAVMGSGGADAGGPKKLGNRHSFHIVRN